MNKVPLMNLADYLPEIKEEIMQKIEEIIDSSSFIGGTECELFEKDFARYAAINFAAGCSNGTDAIIVALLALGIKPGDVVITVPNTFIATAEAVTAIGARVIFCDVDPTTGNMSPAKLLETIEKNRDKPLKAVIPVHLYGLLADMPAIKEICDRYSLKIIEDCAQSHGAEIKGRRAGFWGDIVTYSFYPGKNLGAFGDAGAIGCNNFELFSKIKSLMNHGRTTEKYVHQITGFNKRLDSIQAAILRIKLKYIEKWTEERIEKALIYNRKLMGANLETPIVPDCYRHVYYVYQIVVEKRDELAEKLKKNSIETGIYYPLPLHLQPAFKNIGYKKGDFPVSEELSEKILALPLWPQMPEKTIDFVCGLIKESL